jgi:hypothetical protein
MSGNPASSAAADVKGSKQKIFQLREELNNLRQSNNPHQSIINANPRVDKLRKLQQAYETSKQRAEEVLSSTDLNSCAAIPFGASGRWC